MYNVGIINNRPWLAVKVLAKIPLCKAPWTVATAPASDCISTTFTLFPKKFISPLLLNTSIFSAIGEAGVIGYIPANSINL